MIQNYQIRNFEIIDKEYKLKRLVNKMMKLEEFAYDTETNTLKVLGENKDFSLVGVSISWGKDNNYYIPTGHLRTEDLHRQLDVETVAEYLKKPFEREDVRVIGHNLKFDMHVMSRIGINIKSEDLFDTMIASWLCDENTPNGLKENSLKLLKVQQSHFSDVVDTIPKEVKKEFGLKANSKAPFSLALIDDGAPYALDDAYYTWELYRLFMSRLEEEGMINIYKKVYVPFIRTIYNMEEQGVTVDLDRLQEMREDITKDLEELKYKMFELAGVEFNPKSNQQLSELLFGYEKLDKEGNVAKTVNQDLINASFKFKKLSVTSSGAPQTNADVLWRLSQQSFKSIRKQEGVELCDTLLDFKKLEKLKSAFIDGLQEQLYDDGKAHPSFNIIGTDSGRLSCSQPNLQQLPKASDEDKYQIRSLFIGSEYETEDEVKRKKIIALDFSNLEMRVLAHFSEDTNLLNMFANGEDTHGSTAVNMFELPCEASEVKKEYPHLRQAAKVLNFLLMYGGGAETLYNNLKSDHFNPVDLGDEHYLNEYGVKKGVDVAQIYIDKYFSTYSGVSEFIKRQKRFAHKNEYVLTLLRRKRRLPDINSDNFGKRAYCERLSVNSAVQGSAADITMSAQNRVNADPWFKEHDAHMLIQVHDELVFECPEEYADECIRRAKAYMEHPFGDNVELNVKMIAEYDIGDSYQEAK